MFCPNCGNADQKPETFCRNCGNFLPDFESQKKTPPEQHFKANIVLNVMTAVVSLTLAILLYSFFLGREDTSPLIYLTAGFLTAMFFWQVQILWRTLQLKKQFPKRTPVNNHQTEKIETTPLMRPARQELLNEANFENFIQPGVTEETTRHLAEKLPRKSS